MPVDRGRQDVSDAPQRGVATVPAADGMVRPLGSPVPVPHNPGAPNPTATNPLPNESPAAADSHEMPLASGPHVSKVR
jgi:hypothetical protein